MSVDDLPPPIPASTVVVIRDATDGLEVLMLRRNSKIAFGGMWAFPGGRVDLADRVNDDDEHTSRRCAVREASEEADLVLDADQLVAFAHWEPPPVMPKRFATWFFLAANPRGAAGDVLVDGGEIDEHEWLRPSVVLERRDEGLVELAPPTWVTLHDLGHAETTDQALAWARSRSPIDRYVTHWCQVDDGAVAMWDGDAGYAASDPFVQGDRNRLWMTSTKWRLERTRP